LVKRGVQYRVREARLIYVTDPGRFVAPQHEKYLICVNG
jgi:hypothetical protein